MKIPERQYGRLTTAGVFHIRDWRRNLEVALCDAFGVGKLFDDVVTRLPEDGHVCRNCIRKEDELRWFPVIDHVEEVDIDGLTVPQLIEHLMTLNIPPDARIGSKDADGYSFPVLRWEVTS